LSHISWSILLSNGVSTQDAQHKNLLNQLSDAKLANCSPKVLGTVLTELMNYTVCHFGYEEKLMEIIHYEDAASHKVVHSGFVQTCAELNSRFNSGDVSIADDVINLLQDWHKNHVMTADKKFGQALNKAGIF